MAQQRSKNVESLIIHDDVFRKPLKFFDFFFHQSYFLMRTEKYEKLQQNLKLCVQF